MFFLIDSITNRRSAEPIWFRFLRGFFAIILAGIIMYYLITQLEKIDTEAFTIITLKTFTKSELMMSIYPEIPNIIAVVNDFHADVKNQEVSLSYNYYKYALDPGNKYNISISTQQYIMNNMLFLRFTSFKFYPTEIGNPDNKTPDIKQSQFSLYLGQAYIITFEPTIEIDGLDLNLRLEQSSAIGLEPDKIQIEIYPRSNPCIVKSEKTRNYNVTDLISNLGGFYGGIAGIFVLFFGMDKHEPWGLAQKYLFSCTPCRRSLKRKFAKKYVSSAGIPLVEEVNKRPKKLKESKESKEFLEENVESLKENVESLEERIQILETLLEDYYLDVYYLKKVKKVITKHAKQEDLLKKYKQNEAESITVEIPEIPIDENESNTAVDEEAG